MAPARDTESKARESVASRAFPFVPGRRPAGAHAVLRPPAAYRRLLAPGYRATPVALALGMVCLLADVGRADRLLLLLTSPALSHVAVGAWSLAVCAVLAVLAALLKQAVGAGLTARGLDENGEPRRNLPGGPQEN